MHNPNLAGADVNRVQGFQNTRFVANTLVVTLAELSTASAAPVVPIPSIPRVNKVCRRGTRGGGGAGVVEGVRCSSDNWCLLANVVKAEVAPLFSNKHKGNTKM